MLLRIFINDPHDKTENTLVKFAHDAKVGGKVNTSEGRAILLRVLNKLEEWPRKDCMKVNKDRCCTWAGISKEPKTVQDLCRWTVALLKDTSLHSALVRLHVEYCVQCVQSGPHS